MIINQNIQKRSVLLLTFVLFFTQSFFGQNFISDIQLNGRSIPKIDIVISSPNGEDSKVEITKRTVIKSESIINVPSSNITVFLTSINGNIVEITGPSKLLFRTNERREEYRLIDGGASSNILINVFKELTGGVLASGPTNRIQARSRATKFLLRLEDEEDLTVVLKEGKIDVNSREKIEIKDEIVIGNENKRALFVRETKPLTNKDSIFNYDPNNELVQFFEAESEIKNFLQNQFKKQKKTMLKSGSNSKRAFKEVDRVKSVEDGIASFSEAIDNGEISVELIIQSAFLFADSYYQNDDLERSLAWLEAGLSFGKEYYENKQEVLNDFKKNNELVNAFRYDMLAANEFYAWGFDIKLKINGCLENENENPTKYRSDAKYLIEEIKDNK
ncbi:MAG: hypothetical protein HKO67_12605 [Flavobacteriaceae bacterium]|nr:hypothetical protein [Bacteroidia bacterium]NNL81322.1 hypothetical protein [Flavobacteriaceae bacterium]